MSEENEWTPEQVIAYHEANPEVDTSRIQRALELLEAVEKLEAPDCTLTLYKTAKGTNIGAYSPGKLDSFGEPFVDIIIALSNQITKQEGEG